MELLTKKYLEQLEILHKSPSWGSGPATGLYDICEFVRANNMDGNTKVLDYGCGKGMLITVLRPTLNIYGYDPAVKRFSKLPTHSDYTVCADVLEHVEENCLNNVLNHISCITKNKVLLIICTVEARDTLPDGRNAHINIKSTEKWIEVLSNYFNMESVTANHKLLNYIGVPTKNINSTPSIKWKK